MTMDIDQPGDLNMDSLVSQAKNHVLAKLTGKKLGQLANLETEQKEIQTLLESTIVSNEGNSCLLMGPRSTGKTTLIETTIKNLKIKYPDQFITIRLSGFAQSEDKMALREITHQLDTILNSKLDAATQQAVEEAIAAGEFTGIEQKSISETLRGLLASFEHADAQSMSVIFILEEFDRFTVHPRQTLLYNLLDLSQTAKVGIAVVGTTARMNTREMLEKRVRSRFSQRLYTIKRPGTLESFWNICTTNLFLDDQAFPSDFSHGWNSHLEVCVLRGSTSGGWGSAPDPVGALALLESCVGDPVE
ncbi:origin recognition complex subunit 4 [Sugiyamaella lignohabitans]|uniref:Origin recognition complex subunit 4 n=1 Tax=Sugiyamaella lignohabitans TaxID=796027 RepID=A0A161HH38_9ASCO|nr:origin recognition complex subunit 4 [Sugiyamaella lignohabitans]ANB11307.1 origin recognition complex subunit 4 [Sugiyamaella lignohabitans]